MKLLLTKAQLLKEWQLRSFPEPVNAGCTVEFTGGVDLAAYMSARMDDWYRALLADAPLEMLAPVDISSRVRVSLTDGGTALIRLPDDAVRVASLTLKGAGSVVLTGGSAGESAISMSLYSRRGGRRSTVAVVDGSALRIYPPLPFDSVPEVESLMAVVDVDGEYRLDSRALSTITPECMG